MLVAEEKTEIEMTQTYEIMVPNAGTLTTLGTIAFDSKNNSELTLVAEDAAGALLKERWTEISGYPEIDFESARREQQEDGSWLRSTMFEKIGRDNPDYPAVAMQFLQIHFGYRFVLRPAAD